MAELLCSMWDLPRPGIKPRSLALAGGFFITEPPGKPWTGVFWWWPWVGFSVTEMNPHLAGTRRFSSPKSDGEAGARVVPGVSSRERERKHQGKLKQVSWEGILFCPAVQHVRSNSFICPSPRLKQAQRVVPRSPFLTDLDLPWKDGLKALVSCCSAFDKSLMAQLNISQGFSLVAQLVKNLPHNVGDPSMIPGSRRSPEEGKGYPLQYSGLENSWGHRVRHDWATFTLL